MNWNKTALIVCWCLFLLVLGGATTLVVTSPDTELPYVYSPEKDDSTSKQASASEKTPDKRDVPDRIQAYSADAEEPEATLEATPPTAEDTAQTESTEPPATEPSPSDTEISETEDQTAPTTGGESEQPVEQSTAETALSEDTTGTDSQASATEQGNPARDQQAALTPQHQDTAPRAPAVEADTRPAWQKYASNNKYDDRKPRIAVIVSGLGLSRAATDAAIRQLPAEVSLSFSPYAKQLEGWIALSRSLEHETLMDLPLEPSEYPKDDPGPRTLLTAADQQTNLRNLDWISRRGSEVIGFTAFMGGRFVTSASQMDSLFDYLKVRGFAFLDNGLNPGSLTPSVASSKQVPYAVANSVIDNTQLSRVVIDSKLAQIERLAVENGSVIALGRPYPVTLERLANWTGELEARGFQLVPVSAVLNSPR